MAFVLLVCFLPLTFGMSSSVWPPEVKVAAKPAPPKGDGVFASEAISHGTFVCCYHGQLLTVDEELELYPERYPDYCLQIGNGYSIDGSSSNHWSRLINHNSNPNLLVHADQEQQTAHFTAARDIAPDEELCFDYGVAFFIFRGITPAPGTESRSLTLQTESAADCAANNPPATPRTPEEIRDFMENEDDFDTKKATLIRGLDFYAGVEWPEEKGMVSIPISLDGKRQTVAYDSVSLEFLCEVLGSLWTESHRKEGAGER